MLELLTLEPECHLDQTGRLDGATPLHLAVAIEAPDLRKDFIEFLLEKGANYTFVRRFSTITMVTTFDLDTGYGI